MLDQAYVQKAKAAGARQRIEVVQFSTDTESVGKVVTTRAEELKADMVVSLKANFATRLGNNIVNGRHSDVISCPIANTVLKDLISQFLWGHTFWACTEVANMLCRCL